MGVKPNQAVMVVNTQGISLNHTRFTEFTMQPGGFDASLGVLRRIILNKRAACTSGVRQTIFASPGGFSLLFSF